MRWGLEEAHKLKMSWSAVKRNAFPLSPISWALDTTAASSRSLGRFAVVSIDKAASSSFHHCPDRENSTYLALDMYDTLVSQSTTPVLKPAPMTRRLK